MVRRGKSVVQAKPEIIVKESFALAGPSTRLYAYPVVVILANPEGWKRLATECRRMATRQVHESTPDPDDHSHFGPFWFSSAMNERLSDEIEFRVGSITPTNRRAVLKHYGITRASRNRGSLIERFERLIRRVKEHVQQ